VRLEVNHEEGPLRVFALFSDEPIASAEVEAAVAKVGSIADAEQLPLERSGVVQRSVFFQVGK
jgi:hypothetical protein